MESYGCLSLIEVGYGNSFPPVKVPSPPLLGASSEISGRGVKNTGPKNTKTASKWPFACVPLGWKSMLRSGTTSITGGEGVN